MMAALQIPDATGELLRNEPMSRHTSWRVGGLAAAVHGHDLRDGLELAVGAEEPVRTDRPACRVVPTT